MGMDVEHGTGIPSVLLATPDSALRHRLREELAKTRCAVLPLESLGETERAAVVLRFDHIILDAALCSRPRDLADFTARLDPGQRLVLLQEPDHPLPESALNPRCQIRKVARTSHPGILVSRLRTALEADSQAMQVGRLTRKNISVLLVDPEPMAQDLILHHLLAQGYLVLSIPNPVEAIHTAEDLRFDVLMVEAMLPFGGARKLANSLCGINPRLKVLFLSSHPGDLLIESGVLPPGAPVLQKPLRRREILDSLEALIRRGEEWRRLPHGKPDSPAGIAAGP